MQTKFKVDWSTPAGIDAFGSPLAERRDEGEYGMVSVTRVLPVLNPVVAVRPDFDGETWIIGLEKKIVAGSATIGDRGKLNTAYRHRRVYNDWKSGMTKREMTDRYDVKKIDSLLNTVFMKFGDGNRSMHDDNRDRVKADLEAGMDPRDIMERHMVSSLMVSKCINELGLAATYDHFKATRKRTGKYDMTGARAERMARTEARNKRIAADYENGDHIDDITARHGVSKNTVYAVAGRYDVTRRAELKRRYTNREQIMGDYAAGAPMAEILEKYDIKKNAVYKMAALDGVRRPKKPKQAKADMPRPVRRDNTKARDESIVKDYLVGVPVREIAERYGMKETVVYNIAFKQGAKRPKDGSHRKQSKEIKARNDAVIKDYEEGMHAAEIADKHGMNKNSVYTITKRAGAERKVSVWQEYEDRDRAIAEDVDGGMTVNQAAEKAGVSYHVAYKAYNKAGGRLRRGNPERDMEICRRRMDGETNKSLAEAFGLTPQNVTRILKKGGVI